MLDPAHTQLHEAIDRAAAAVLARQHPTGYWRGCNDGGPMYLAATIALEAALGSLDAARAARARHSLLAAQLPDGGLPAWPTASQSNAEATLYLIAALHAVEVRGEPLRAAERRLATLGGPRKAGPLALMSAALVGALPSSVLPRVPHWLALAPGHDRLVAALLGVNTLLPLRTLPFLAAMRRQTSFPIGEPPQLRGLAHRSALALDRHLRARQAASGGLAGVPIFTLLGLLCLRACGAELEDPALVRGLEYVRRVEHPIGEGLFVEPFESTYWDTAHMVRVLARIPTARHCEAARRGAAFLVRGQSSEPSPPEWQCPPPDAPSSGGWSWQPGNEHNPDFDTTAEVLSALAATAALSPDDRRALAPAIDRGLAWLLAFQNPDGGWAAFSHGKPRPPLGALHVPRRHPGERVRAWLAENGDPSTADIVGRVLYGLGALAQGDHPAIARALDFLAAHRVEPSGAWWGRWAINYLAGTAYVVSGIAKVGARPAWLAPALDWMIACQNGDGGWGETPRSYDDPGTMASGPSTIALTGLVTWALQVAGRRRDPAVARGIDFLLAHQHANGEFIERAPFSTMFPGRAYWLNDTYPTFFALEALLERHHG